MSMKGASYGCDILIRRGAKRFTRYAHLKMDSTWAPLPPGQRNVCSFSLKVRKGLKQQMYYVQR